MGSPHPPRPLKVVHVVNDLRVGGAERLLVDLVPRLRAVGVDASVVVLGEAPGGSFLVDRLLEGAGGQLDVPTPPLPLRSPRQVRRLRPLLAGADVAHVHLFPSQLWTAAAARSLPPGARPVLVTTEHNTTNRRRRAAFRLVDAAMYRAYARIVAISDAAAANLVEWAPSTRDRLVTIHNGVDVDQVVSAPAADRLELFGVGPDVPVVACTGRFEEQKDQATLVRALPQVPGLHAAFVGDGPMRPGVMRLADELGVAERVHFLGLRPDVPAVLKACDLYCQPSRWEGFGIAVVEALAAGLPTVVSDVPGVADIAGGAGLTFPPGDHLALARALTSLTTDESARRRSATLGPERARLFDVSHYVDAHVALYQELADEQRR
jgi:glycosyltransferase involved in cell wall biosynthesis